MCETQVRMLVWVRARDGTGRVEPAPVDRSSRVGLGLGQVFDRPDRLYDLQCSFKIILYDLGQFLENF